MTQETETAVTPETPTPAGGLTPPPDLGAPAEPLQEPPEGQPPEGQGEPVEGQAPPTTWSALEETDWFPASLEERDKSRDDVLRKEMKREAYREFDPHKQRQEASFSNLTQGGQKTQRTLERLVEDGKWDRREAQDWAEDNKDFVNALNGAYWGAGVERALTELATAADDKHLLPDMYTRLSSLLQGQRDPSFFNDFAERIAEPRVKASEERAKAAERELKEFKAAKAAQAQPPAQGAGVLTPGSPAGGKSISTMGDADIAYANDEISHEEYKQYRERFNVPSITR